MRRMLVSRMSRRVLAEHHIALSDVFNGREYGTDSEGHVGIIYTGLDVEKSVLKCASILRESTQRFSSTTRAPWPEVVVDGHHGMRFPYIKEHLE